MELEQVKAKKKNPPPIEDMDFDFKPITSGLGFHHPKTTDVKPVITERTIAINTLGQPSNVSPKKEMNVYQNDLSLFYGQSAQVEVPDIPVLQEPVQNYFRLAEKSHRVFAYVIDLLLLASVLSLVVMVMAKTISMDVIEIWGQYPNEITPLVLTLFCGFYLIYFSIFDKTGSTIGKSIFSLKVTGINEEPLALTTLIARSSISLLNFISLGLFSYFDLQNKVTSSKVIRID